jgi:hypothetical protein
VIIDDIMHRIKKKRSTAKTRPREQSEKAPSPFRVQKLITLQRKYIARI